MDESVNVSSLNDTENIEEEEDVEPMTSNEVLEKLEEAWLNEKFAPELLEHKTEYIECMLELIQQMEENVKKLKKGDFRQTVHRMEIDRIQYILNSYLRCRLEKIQKFTAFTLEKDKAALDNPCMSPEETVFAKEYLGSIENHFKLLALRHMPGNMPEFDAGNKMPRPNLNKFLFIKAKETAPGLVIDGDEKDDEIELEKGSQHILRYKPISHLLKSGDVSLV